MLIPLATITRATGVTTRGSFSGSRFQNGSFDLSEGCNWIRVKPHPASFITRIIVTPRFTSDHRYVSLLPRLLVLLTVLFLFLQDYPCAPSSAVEVGSRARSPEAVGSIRLPRAELPEIGSTSQQLQLGPQISIA